MYIYIFFWIPYWPRMLINILWHSLAANQYGGSLRRTGSIFSCSKGLWDCLPSKPITTKHQSVFWLVSQSRRMSAICVGICWWISLAAATADPVHATVSTLLMLNCACQRYACQFVTCWVVVCRCLHMVTLLWQVCRDFLVGKCNRTNCRYVHTTNEASQAPVDTSGSVSAAVICVVSVNDLMYAIFQDLRAPTNILKSVHQFSGDCSKLGRDYVVNEGHSAFLPILIPYLLCKLCPVWAWGHWGHNPFSFPGGVS